MVDRTRFMYRVRDGWSYDHNGSIKNLHISNEVAREFPFRISVHEDFVDEDKLTWWRQNCADFRLLLLPYFGDMLGYHTDKDMEDAYAYCFREKQWAAAFIVYWNGTQISNDSETHGL